MTYTPEQMLESAETLDCQGSPFKTYAAQLRQGAAAVRAAEAGKVLRDLVDKEMENDDLEMAVLFIDRALKAYDAALTETKP